MKRSVMRQGPSTLVVSLPSQWTKKFSISKGDELHVEEHNGLLTVSPQKTKTIFRIELDVSGTMPMTNRICGALYKAGYDEIVVHYKSPEELDQIINCFQQVIGLDVVDHGRGTITVRRLAQLDAEQFDQLLKKQFHILHSMASDTLAGISEGNMALLKEVIARDRTLGKFSDFCRRSLLQSYIHARTPALYHAVEQLEKVADIYKKICIAFTKKPVSVNKATLELISRVNTFVGLLHGLFYNFDLKKVTAFGVQEQDLHTELEEYIRTSSRQELGLLVRLSEIVDMTFDMNGSIMVSRIGLQ